MMEKPSFDQVAKELRLDELKDCLAGQDCAASFQAAEVRLQGNTAVERLPHSCAQNYALFRLLVDDKEGRLRWQALQETNPEKFWDRDSEVVEIWRRVESGCRAEDFIAGRWSVLYHHLWIFDWLLRRYDVRRARGVVGGRGWGAQNVHFLLLGAIAMIYVLRRLEKLGADQTSWTLLLCAAAYIITLLVLTHSFGKLPAREAFGVATQSLIPRLAGAAAVGLLFLFSSSDLIPVLLATKILWLLALLLAVYGYLLLEMSRRVHPLPRLRRLALHAFDISVTALAHSLTLTLLAEGALRKLLHDRGPFGWHESFSLAVFVFSIGLVVNLIWAEQPVTEPL